MSARRARHAEDGPAALVGVALEKVLRQKQDVAAAGAQRGHVRADDVDAVEEVLAEALLLDLRLEVAVRGREDARVERLLLVAADRAHRALLQGTQELGLHPGGHLADLVEEERALARPDEEARPRGTRVGEGALHVPEQLALEQVLGHRRAVDRHEGPVPAPALRVQRLGDELLAGPALARDEHRRLGVGHARDELAHLQHRGAGPEDLLEALGAVDLLAEALDLLAERPVPERPLDRERELVHIERFRDEVVRAGPDRGDRRLHVRVGRDHDDRHVLAAADELLAELDAVHAGHVHVGDREPEVFALEEGDGRVRIGDRGHLELAPAELAFEHFAEAAIVVNDEDAAVHAVVIAGRWGAREALYGRRTRSATPLPATDSARLTGPRHDMQDPPLSGWRCSAPPRLSGAPTARPVHRLLGVGAFSIGGPWRVRLSLRSAARSRSWQRRRRSPGEAGGRQEDRPRHRAEPGALRGQRRERRPISISIVCHDLKDPLASIVMGAGFLTKDRLGRRRRSPARGRRDRPIDRPDEPGHRRLSRSRQARGGSHRARPASRAT